MCNILSNVSLQMLIWVHFGLYCQVTILFVRIFLCESSAGHMNFYCINFYHAISVLLRPALELFACTRLTATYRTCLWSVSTCTVMSSHTGLIQATAARPHGCNNQARICSVASSNIVPEGVSQFQE